MEMTDSKDCSIHYSSIAWTPYSHSWKVLATSLLRRKLHQESPSSPIFRNGSWVCFSSLSVFCLSPSLFLSIPFPSPEGLPWPRSDRASALHRDSLLPEPMGSPVYTQESFIFIYIGKKQTGCGWHGRAFSRLPASSKVLFERPHKGSVCIGEVFEPQNLKGSCETASKNSYQYLGLKICSNTDGPEDAHAKVK